MSEEAATEAGGMESAGAALGVDLAAGVPAPVAEAAPTESAPEAPQESPAWLEPFGSEDRAFIGNKGWSGPEAMLASYRSAEGRIGGDPDKSVLLPDWEDAAQVSAFRSKLGVPESAGDYPEHVIETMRGPLEMGTVAQISHEVGLTPAQHAKLAELTGQLVDSASQEEEAAYSAKLAAESKEVMADHGGTPQEFNAMVQKGIAALELTPAQASGLTQAVGLKAAVKILQTVTDAMSEKSTVTEGDSSGMMGSMSQEVAKQRLRLRQQDESFRTRMFNGDAAAIEEWQNLQAAAATPE